ncbi:hypothetical protein TKK_0013875 [Trichogramma kaykai]
MHQNSEEVSSSPLDAGATHRLKEGSQPGVSSQPEDEVHSSVPKSLQLCGEVLGELQAYEAAVINKGSTKVITSSLLRGKLSIPAL